MDAIKDILSFVIKYLVPIIALALSIISFNRTKDIISIDKKLKKYELEEIEKERVNSELAHIDVNITPKEKGLYSISFHNTGKSTAYNINFKVSDNIKDNIIINNVPFEFLESGKSFNELLFRTHGMPNKFKITTEWTDQQSQKTYKNEQIISF